MVCDCKLNHDPLACVKEEIENNDANVDINAFTKNPNASPKTILVAHASSRK
jgi:hypothetical protein